MKDVMRHIPSRDREKLLGELNQSGRAVVVLQKNHRLRVYDLEKYMGHVQLMRRVIQTHKPWVKRQRPLTLLGPIGSKPLGVQENLSRAAIYEGR